MFKTHRREVIILIIIIIIGETLSSVVKLPYNRGLVSCVHIVSIYFKKGFVLKVHTCDKKDPF